MFKFVHAVGLAVAIGLAATPSSELPVRVLGVACGLLLVTSLLFSPHDVPEVDETDTDPEEAAR